MLDDIHSFYLAYKLQGSFKVSFTLMNLDFEAVPSPRGGFGGFLATLWWVSGETFWRRFCFEVHGFSTDLHSQIGKTIKILSRQMIKIHERPTNNAEQFCGPSKEENFKCEHFTNFCAGLDEIFGLHGFELPSFVICFNVVEFILF